MDPISELSSGAELKSGEEPEKGRSLTRGRSLIQGQCMTWVGEKLNSRILSVEAPSQGKSFS